MLRILPLFFVFLSLSAVAQQPVLNGGLEAFINKNIIYPPFAVTNCIQGTVKVGFKLNKAGEVYDTRVEQGIGAGLDNEAIRLVRLSSGKWNVPSSYDTASLFIVPVNFVLKGFNCETRTKAEIALALQSYNSKEELFEVVTNFYKAKELGIFKSEDETRIIAIKNDLGIDDEYLDDRIAIGMARYKQGDKVGACEEFKFVKYMGSDKADSHLSKYCN